MDIHAKAEKIRLFSLKTPQMRAFHMTWFAFFLCFFGWFGIVPLHSYVKADLGLTDGQVTLGNILAVASTVLMRLIVGPLCDRFGPRRTYTWLLVLGSLAVMGIGLSWDLYSFLTFRTLIGGIGAAFVITQYHTSCMFAPNCVGAANAITAGFGNSGAGATIALTPLIFAGILAAVMGLGGVDATDESALAAAKSLSWRLAMVPPGLLMIVTAMAYSRFTLDAPEGNIGARPATAEPARKRGTFFMEALRDYRVWMLFLIYGLCFGVELVFDKTVHSYLSNSFALSNDPDRNIMLAGIMGGAFGLMAMVARPIGGLVADRCGRILGLRGRVMWLFAALLCEGLAIMAFSQMGRVPAVVVSLIVMGVFVHMSCGATYAVVPFVNKRAVGSVSGIVGAGGNAMTVLLMFVLIQDVFSFGLSTASAYLVIGGVVTAGSFLALGVRFTPEAEAEARRLSPQPRPATHEQMPLPRGPMAGVA